MPARLSRRRRLAGRWFQLRFPWRRFSLGSPGVSQPRARSAVGIYKRTSAGSAVSWLRDLHNSWWSAGERKSNLASAVRTARTVEAAPATPLVIQRKLTVPPLSETRVARPRVERRLSELVERHRIVVLSATAGSG